MSQTLRLAGLAASLLILTWVLAALVLAGLYPGITLTQAVFHPPISDLLFRLASGIALASGVVSYTQIRGKSRQAKEALLQQREDYRTLVECSPECVMVHVDEIIVFANANLKRFFGLDDAQLAAGVSTLEPVQPESLDKLADNHQRLHAGQNPGPVEIRMRRADGEIRQILATNSIIQWEDQTAVLTFFRDITEELHNRKEMQTSSERLQLALDAARDGVWDWDITTGRMVYSQSWASMLGFNLEEVSGTLDTWRSLIHPADYLRAQTMVDNHLEGFVPGYEIEVRLRHKNGHYIWVLDRGRVVERDEQGNPLRMTGTHRDITARKEAELALEIRNRVAEAFLTSDASDLFGEILNIICATLEAPVGLFTTLGSQNILHVVASSPAPGNRLEGMETALSFSQDSLHPVFDLVINQGHYCLENSRVEIPQHEIFLDSVLGVPISDRRKVLGAIFAANKTGGFQQSDRLFLESLAGYIAPILQSHLNSQAKEGQLRQAQKMEALGSLAGGIAHDFNNILQAIMGFTTLALEEAGTEGHLPSDLQRVLKATRRGQELVQRILLFSRREELKQIPVEIQAVVEEALNLLKRSIPTTIEIKQNLDAPMARILGDPGQISQVILNLATNAYHAMDSTGGVLDIGLTVQTPADNQQDRPESIRGKSGVLLTISDTGAGMSDDVKARIFDPFFTTKEVGQGTGLGMSIVHGIVETHDGAIHVHSELAIGTTVTVFFPLLIGEEESLVQEAPITAPRVSGRGRHVALVDDEEDIADLGRALLERVGYRVTTENNGRRLLDQLAEEPALFDLVITDLMMPQITGLQLAHEVEEIRPDLPILLITGMTETRQLDLEAHANIRGLIRKPFGREVLLEKVQLVLEQATQKKGD